MGSVNRHAPPQAAGKARQQVEHEGLLPVILVLTVPPSERDLEGEREDEMRALLDTAGCEVKAVARQHLNRPVKSTYIGSGKAKEIWDLVEDHAAEEVIFDVSLTPSQERNLEKLLEVKVVDYTALILHIFAKNARTHQSMLAVELAQLEHNRSRLKRLWSHLDRIKAGMNMRGPGEKQLETDRRLVDLRISELKSKLKVIEERKDRTIQQRDSCVKVALVGYTNAGKSTVMNALTQAEVLAQDRLFATLDTRTARLELDHRHEIVLSDTVGFIRNLPHKLVASFHATLVEVIEADLLLHVVDSSGPGMEEHIQAVEEVLREIGAAEIPTIHVFNKADRPHSPTLTLAFRHRYPGSVMVSALNGDGLEQLKSAILSFVNAREKRYRARFHASDGALYAFLRGRCEVIEEDYDGEEVVLTITADERTLAELNENHRLTIEDLPAPAYHDPWVMSNPQRED
ncbi:MAG: GTPase HflX [Planctomycetota bacterium]|nr:MAG: GTPase HflX [Planctomycetota bacterium]